MRSMALHAKSVTMCGGFIPRLDCSRMTLIAQFIVLGDQQSRVISRMRVMAVGTVQLRGANRMDTGFLEIILDVGVTVITDVRFRLEQQGSVVGAVRLMAAHAVIVSEWLMLNWQQAQGRYRWMTHEAEVCLAGDQDSLPGRCVGVVAIQTMPPGEGGMCLIPGHLGTYRMTRYTQVPLVLNEQVPVLRGMRLVAVHAIRQLEWSMLMSVSNFCADITMARPAQLLDRSHKTRFGFNYLFCDFALRTGASFSPLCSGDAVPKAQQPVQREPLDHRSSAIRRVRTSGDDGSLQLHAVRSVTDSALLEHERAVNRWLAEIRDQLRVALQALEISRDEASLIRASRDQLGYCDRRAN